MNKTPYERIVEAAETLGLEILEGVPKPDETYLACRNGPAQLLTCREVNETGGWIVPKEIAYCFDIRECYRVREKK